MGVVAGIGSDIADALLRGLANAVLAGVAHLAAWAIGGVVHAVVVSTMVDPGRSTLVGRGRGL